MKTATERTPSAIAQWYRENRETARVYDRLASWSGNQCSFNGKLSDAWQLCSLDQQSKLLALTIEYGKEWMADCYLESRCIRDGDSLFYVPSGMILGVWPHCKMFGGMDATGRIHT